MKPRRTFNTAPQPPAVPADGPLFWLLKLALTVALGMAVAGKMLGYY